MFIHGSKIHFLGICGTAMAGVAAALKERGCLVTGSDANVYPPMSTYLAERGIHIQTPYAASNLAHRPDLVVVGNAISRGNPELEEALDQRLPYTSLPGLLHDHFLPGKRNTVVTGTHGKTTTTALVTWILETAGKQPSYLIGGIPVNLAQGACFRDGPVAVMEGDEYDTAFFDKRPKFLHYLPEVVVINNIEYDHADIYENLDAILLAFRRLVQIVPRSGLIVANGDDPHVRQVLGGALSRVIFVGCDETAAPRIADFQAAGQVSRFKLGGMTVEIPLAGLFNVRNAAMAVVVSRHLEIPDSTIQKALSSFRGVRRRQEMRAVVNDITLVDDFGHHPTAIRETLIALRDRYPGARLWAFFEPRSNTTRRAVFQKELPEALALADGVFVGQVARLDQLPPENRLDPERVIADILAHGKPAYYMPSVDEIVTKAVTLLRSGDVAVIFSNGSFDGIHEKLIHALER